MKTRLCLWLKCFWILLLFVNGILLAGLVFPALSGFGAHKARHYRDAVKMAWLQCFSLILGCKVQLAGELPKPGALLVSNHVSWLDIIVLGRFLPGYFVAKSDILTWPVIGFLAKQAGTIFIRRGDKKHIQGTAEQMLWLLKQQRNIFVFPEGTTTVGAEVLPFHNSLFQPAVITKADVQPVAISYLGAAKTQAPFIGDDEFLPHLINMLGFDTIEVRVQFLPVLSSVGNSRANLSAAARASIYAALHPNAECEHQAFPTERTGDLPY